MNIGQAAKASGVSQRMIRHYEAIGLIPKAARRDSGYRNYDDRDVHMLRFIRRARDLGFPIAEIAQLVALWQNSDRARGEVKALALARQKGLQHLGGGRMAAFGFLEYADPNPAKHQFYEELERGVEFRAKVRRRPQSAPSQRPRSAPSTRGSGKGESAPHWKYGW